MTTHRSHRAISLVVALLAASCSTVPNRGKELGLGKSGVFIEQTLLQQGVSIRRVAIVPNRLPANLLDPEKWRRFNFQVLQREFKKQGIDVVDYESAARVFESSGLPVEDTKVSREKYAEFAQALGVDAIVVPYYGTFSWSTSLLVINTAHFAVSGSLQVYLASANDFLARIDVSAEESYTTGYATVAGLGVMVIGTALAAGSASSGTPPSSAPSIIGGGLTIADVVLGLIMAARAPDGYWQTAFDKAITRGLAPFFASLRSHGGGPGSAVRRGATTPAQPSYQPAPQPTYQPAPQPSYQPAPQPSYQPAPQPSYQPAPQPSYQPAPQPSYQPAPQPTYQPAPVGAPLPGGCVSNAECRNGLVCQQGQCVQPATGVKGCTTSADCPAGRICLAGQCQ